MNRSRRRAVVMSWTLTAGVLCGTGGVSAAASIGLAAPAQAEPAAVDRAPDNSPRSSGADRRGNPVGGQPRARSQVPGIRPVDSTAQRRSPGRPAGRGSAGEAPGENAHSAQSPEWHCHINWPHINWPVWPDLPVRPVPLPLGVEKRRMGWQLLGGNCPSAGPSARPVPGNDRARVARARNGGAQQSRDIRRHGALGVASGGSRNISAGIPASGSRYQRSD